MRDGVGEDAVDTDRGEDDGERGEAGDEQHDEAALPDQIGDALIHGLDIEEGLLTVDGEDGFAHGIGEQDGIGGAAECDVDAVGRLLRLGEIKLGLHLLFETVVADILRDADDSERFVLRQSFGADDGFAERVSSEVLTGKGPVDDRDGKRSRCVVTCKCAALKNGSTDDAEVLGCNADVRRNLPLAAAQRGYGSVTDNEC